MEEKILIKSEQYDIKKIQKIIIGIGLVAFLIIFLTCGLPNILNYGLSDYFHFQIETLEDIGLLFTSYYYFSFGIIYGILIPIIISFIVYSWLKSYELTITSTRVYGKIAWGKRVDLPVDSVSAIATIRVLKGVSVSTSSGRISFLVIKNADEIYKVMNNLLIERQREKVNATVATTAPKSDEADQIKKYKDLLDSGVITQEEFDAKKKQLLGL